MEVQHWNTRVPSETNVLHTLTKSFLWTEKSWTCCKGHVSTRYHILPNEADSQVSHRRWRKCELWQPSIGSVDWWHVGAVVCHEPAPPWLRGKGSSSTTVMLTALIDVTAHCINEEDHTLPQVAAPPLQKLNCLNEKKVFNLSDEASVRSWVLSESNSETSSGWPDRCPLLVIKEITDVSRCTAADTWAPSGY